ncbi:hypothetical protein Slin15195_G087230 [Septoria linicola]|uniref:Uncharacterized protein n=1 Tax=Septoria linicola TaxID=215465 RepID=A0A9Q9AV44_9PEZI|nr:hypothetical protein Slin14017_G089820 [Septoria linicola]USW55404.1 hypothetical protein Slin15195_G087230 [Septoria linicola]
MSDVRRFLYHPAATGQNISSLSGSSSFPTDQSSSVHEALIDPRFGRLMFDKIDLLDHYLKQTQM